MVLKRTSLLLLLALGAASCSTARSRSSSIAIGAIYPVVGSQAPGGQDEYHGALLAAEYVNAAGGVNGKRIDLRLVPTDTPDQAPGSVRALAAQGVPVIIGSYGSTLSRPAADLATSLGEVFWETGAVGILGMSARTGDRVFRFAPTGQNLGGDGVRFLNDELLPREHRDPKQLRFGVSYVDDDYGRSVGFGARDQIRALGLRSAVMFPYSLQGYDAAALARRIAAARIDVLVVSAYLDDGVALRRELVRQKVPLVASIGSSSSYCHPAFGAALGTQAVGLFASDKPDGDVIDASVLSAEAGAALRWARTTFATRFRHPMDAPALTGFAGAWGLFHYVLPAASAMTPDAIAAAARAVDVPMGGMPNGAGLRFPSGVENQRATSVIWEWVKPATREVVWPRTFATSPIIPLRIA